MNTGWYKPAGTFSGRSINHSVIRKIMVIEKRVRKTSNAVQLTRLIVACSIVLISATSLADVKAYIGFEQRYFVQAPLLGVQGDSSSSLTGLVEAFHDFSDGDRRVVFSAYGRVDENDSKRNHVDIGEAYWWQQFNHFELYAGARKVNWGVTESVHLVDVVNQTNVLENIDGEDKLGQPMLQLVTWRDWGTFEAYVLPYFRERQFVGETSRLRPLLPILESAIYESDDKQRHTDFAFRWNHYIGAFDFGLSHFRGTDRQPRFIPVWDETEGSVTALQPYYGQINQTGFAGQATVEAWLWKLELASIEDKVNGRHTAVAGGLEYSFFSVAGTNADLGIIAEYQFDDRRGEAQPVSQDDAVVGARWAFNDIDNSQILALYSQDLEYGNRFFSIEVSRRLTDNWKLEAEFRGFSHVSEFSPEYSFRNDDYIQLEIRRYF